MQRSANLAAPGGAPTPHFVPPGANADIVKVIDLLSHRLVTPRKPAPSAGLGIRAPNRPQSEVAICEQWRQSATSTSDIPAKRLPEIYLLPGSGRSRASCPDLLAACQILVLTHPPGDELHVWLLFCLREAALLSYPERFPN